METKRWGSRDFSEGHFLPLGLAHPCSRFLIPRISVTWAFCVLGEAVW